MIDLLAPEYLDVVNAIKSISPSSVSERGQHVLSKLSLALQTGQSIVKCCDLKKGLGIRSCDKAMTAAAKQFLVLHKTEWTDEGTEHGSGVNKVKKNYTVAELPNPTSQICLNLRNTARVVYLNISNIRKSIASSRIVQNESEDVSGVNQKSHRMKKRDH